MIERVYQSNPTANMAGTKMDAPRMLQVLEQKGLLFETIGRTSDLAAKLHERLSGVMSSPPARPVAAGGDETGLCSMAEDIREWTARLAIANEALDDILYRLEV